MSKTFSPAPDYVIISEGINDHSQSGASVTAAVTSWIASARSAFGPAAKIFIVINIAEIQSAAIKAGVAAAADPLTYVIDPGPEFEYSVFGGPSGTTCTPATWASPDGCHLDAIHHQIYSAFVSAGIQQVLSSRGASAYVQ